LKMELFCKRVNIPLFNVVMTKKIVMIINHIVVSTGSTGFVYNFTERTGKEQGTDPNSPKMA